MPTADRAANKLINWNVPLPSVYDREHPWQRQPFDDDQCWYAFREYMMLTLPRRLDALYRKIGVPVGTLKKWASERAWELRAAAFDNHIQDAWEKAVHDEIEDQSKLFVSRHARILKKAGEIVETELDKYLDLVQSTDVTGALRPNELSQLLERVIKYERLHYDQSTENVAVKADISNLSVDDLKRLKELQSKARKGTEHD